MITLDTSGLFAYLNRRDTDHHRVRETLDAEPEPWIVPALSLCETTYLLERRSTIDVIDALLGDLDRGAFRLDCGDQDIARVRELIHRYADLPLGVADAAVVACAERNGGRVLTLDLRHFGVVAREGRLVLLPA